MVTREEGKLHYRIKQTTSTMTESLFDILKLNLTPEASHSEGFVHAGTETPVSTSVQRCLLQYKIQPTY